MLKASTPLGEVHGPYHLKHKKITGNNIILICEIIITVSLDSRDWNVFESTIYLLV